MPEDKMRFWWLGWLWVGIGACQSQPTIPRMHIQTSDTTQSECQKNCLTQRSLCANQKRGGKPSKKVSRKEWNEIYRISQSRAMRCDKEYRICQARCAEQNAVF